MTTLSTARGSFLAPNPNAPLDPLETPPQISKPDRSRDLDDDLTEATAWIHSGWHAYRQRIHDAMDRIGTPLAVRQRFCYCGSDAWVHQAIDDKDLYKVMASWCHNRWCRVCGNQRGRTIAANVLTATTGKRLRFVTLTLKVHAVGSGDTDSQYTLARRLDHLIKSFARLRRMSDWTRYVSGGAAFLEVKWSATHSGWNVHVHIICTGAYYPSKRLSDAWLRATGDSYIVDVRSVSDSDKIIRYVCKYVSKPLDTSVIRRPDALDEAMQAMRSRRTVITFGSWSGYKLTELHSEHEWEAVGRLDDILERALAGERHAQAIILKLQPQTSLPEVTHDERSPPTAYCLPKPTQTRLWD